jgi:hypothetical protein
MDDTSWTLSPVITYAQGHHSRRAALDLSRRMESADISPILSISPPVLAGFAAIQSSLSTTLDLETRTGIALTVSQANGCSYGSR